MLEKHTHNPVSHRIRKERSDSTIANLQKEYPILSGVRNKTLGGLEKKLGVASLNQALKILREEHKRR